jgi:hypothetical protein
MMKKGPTKGKMKAIEPQKNSALQNIQKMPRAYESLNPALSRWGSAQEVLLNVLINLFLGS